MKKYLLSLVALFTMTVACTTNGSDVINPAIQSNVPAEATGQWMWGTFSMTNFWGYDGSYKGNAMEQSFVLDFKPNGEFEQYVVNAATSYNCRTEALSYFKGKVKFNETERSFTITQTSGNYRGFYSCYPSKNFQRDAKASELKTATFYYDVVTQQGKKQLVLRDSPTDNEPMYLKASN